MIHASKSWAYAAALYLAAADVAVLPNSSQAQISSNYTSPLKLFEYLASGKPVVASNVPAIREIVQNEQTALLVEPDNARALAEGIQRIHSDRTLHEKIRLSGLEVARQHSWKSRGSLIKDFLENLH